jgi:hypothetical protein
MPQGRSLKMPLANQLEHCVMAVAAILRPARTAKESERRTVIRHVPPLAEDPHRVRAAAPLRTNSPAR